MSKFLTWVTNKASEINTDIRHKNRTIDYLNSSEINGKSMYDIVKYIKYWWPRALKDEIVLRKLVQIVLQHTPDEDAVDIYDRTCKLLKNDSETLQSIRYVFSHVPLLFFEIDELFRDFKIQHSSDVTEYYQSLSQNQKAKYAAKALTLNGYLLRDVPMSIVANKQRLYEIAVQESPGAIKNVPIINRTDDMMRNAVCKSAYALEHLTPEKQDEFLEDAIMNPDDAHETHWPSDIWHMVYLKVDNRPEVKSGRAWLQNILKRVDRLKLVDWYIAWHKKRKEEADRQMNEQAMI